MSGLFPKAPNIEVPKPKPVRMPTETDPDIVAAAGRTRKAAMRRQGRQSTILTDAVQSTIGSSGQRLGR